LLARWFKLIVILYKKILKLKILKFRLARIR
jgi:hypothetical protein